MRPRSNDNRGVFAVMAMLVLVLIIVGAIAIRLFVASNDAREAEGDVDAAAQAVRDELAQTKQMLEEAREAATRPAVKDGVFVRVNPDNPQEWLVTVSYPEVPTPPSFQLSYPTTAPWGLMRVGYVDLTATDFPAPTPYLAQFTMRASLTYAEGDKGHVFDVFVVDRAQYDAQRGNPESIYATNKHILIAEDDRYAYLYGYVNSDEEVRTAVDALMSSFVALNAEIK